MTAYGEWRLEKGNPKGGCSLRPEEQEQGCWWERGAGDPKKEQHAWSWKADFPRKGEESEVRHGCLQHSGQKGQPRYEGRSRCKVVCVCARVHTGGGRAHYKQLGAIAHKKRNRKWHWFSCWSSWIFKKPRHSTNYSVLDPKRMYSTSFIKNNKLSVSII